VLLVTTSDITKRLLAEQQLIQASKMATLGEMATGVAHELNQPLSVIKTASSFFMKKISNQEKIDDQILFELSSEIDSYVDRATKIINHMRQFGRKPEMTSEKVQVNDVLQKAFEFFRQQLKLRGISVEWNAQEDLPEIMADPGKLEQVIINLLINARDAIEERWSGGEVLDAEKKIRLRTFSREREVGLEVCDTGTGIPKEILAKIFEPFFTTKRVGKGTGLGLSISYGIVKDYGGNIWADANEDQGTCFTITFPIPGEKAEGGR
jgi:histidine kinase